MSTKFVERLQVFLCERKELINKNILDVAASSGFSHYSSLEEDLVLSLNLDDLVSQTNYNPGEVSEDLVQYIHKVTNLETTDTLGFLDAAVKDVLERLTGPWSLSSSKLDKDPEYNTSKFFPDEVLEKEKAFNDMYSMMYKLLMEVQRLQQLMDFSPTEEVSDPQKCLNSCFG